MVLVESRPAAAVPLRHRRGVLRLLPWMLPLLIGVIGLAQAGVPLGSILRYDVYFLAGVVLPGILILRLVWRSTGNWAEDAALGAAVGIAYQLVGWAIFTALGFQEWLVVWPALVVVAFLTVPRLRVYWRIARPAPLPLAWSWGVAIAVALLVFGVVTGPMLYHLAPPDGAVYHQDMLYHLSMVHELMRSVPPQLPQVAGESLDYHWFANADMAAAADITRLPAELVLFRLWLVPLTVLAVLLTAVLARQVSRQWLAAVIAVAILAAPAVGPLLGLRRHSLVGTLIWYLSPSQTFALIALTAAAVFLVEALYRFGQPGVWGLAIALALVGGGSKPTVLPILLGAVGLAGLYLAVRKRAMPWRSVMACSFLLVAAVVAMFTVTGSTGGSGFRPLAMLRVQPGYKQLTGDNSLAATGSWLLQPIASGQFSVLVVLLAVVLVGQVSLLVGFGLLASRRTQTDPVAWFLIGGLATGWVAFLLVDHPSASEYYFLRGLVPFAAVAAAWMVTVAVRGRNIRRVVVLSLMSLLLGVAIVRGQELFKDPTLEKGWSGLFALSRGVAVMVVVGLLAWLAWRRVLFARPGMVGMGLLIPVLMTVGISLATTVDQAEASRASKAPPVYTTNNMRLTPDEQAAAFWLAAHSDPEDVVATNTACWPGRPDCVSLGYLVSGLAGRRTMLEGWAYTQQAMAQHGNGGKAYMLQPSPWQDRRQLTQMLFTTPTPELVRRLHEVYGVRWIFADRAGNRKPSVKFGPAATLAYENAQVQVFRVTGN